jgi:hypothetical protein
MDAVLRDIVATFETALGPFGDPGVIARARELPRTISEPTALRVLMQAHTRVGVRPRAVLLTVVGDTLSLSTADGLWREWALAGCAIAGEELRLAGRRLSIVPADGRAVTLSRATPVDEVPRLVAAVDPETPAGTVSRRPPVARLGAAAALYDDRIAFFDGPTHSLAGGVRARALEMPGATATTLRSVSRLMQGARGRPRHVLVDGPDWSQVAAAPETAPELADAFADAVNRWAAR